jgi:hypothetical protein
VKARYYSDKRDLVKWSVLLHLAKRTGARRIVQVACLVPDEKELEALALDFGREVADEVWRHFRDWQQVTELGRDAGIDVRVVSGEYPVQAVARDAYFARVAAEWLAPGHDAVVLFLDPDTGLGTRREHVSKGHLLTLKASMTPRDVLVVYQHAPRFGPADWQVEAQQRFGAALGVPRDEVDARQSPVAKDVAFLSWRAA